MGYGARTLDGLCHLEWVTRNFFSNLMQATDRRILQKKRRLTEIRLERKRGKGDGIVSNATTRPRLHAVQNWRKRVDQARSKTPFWGGFERKLANVRGRKRTGLGIIQSVIKVSYLAGRGGKDYVQGRRSKNKGTEPSSKGREGG